MRYRYYVSKALQHEPSIDSTEGMRIPAREIEGAVASRLGEALDDPLGLFANAGISVEPDELRTAIRRAEGLARSARSKDRTLIRAIVPRICMLLREIRIDLRTTPLLKLLGVHSRENANACITLASTVRLKRTGMAMRLVHTNGMAAFPREPDAPLVRLLLTARAWWAKLATGEIDIATLAPHEQVNDSWVTRVIRLNFLAPAMVEAILAGEQPARLTADALVSAGPFPVDWDAQDRLLNDI